MGDLEQYYWTVYADLTITLTGDGHDGRLEMVRWFSGEFLRLCTLVQGWMEESQLSLCHL